MIVKYSCLVHSFGQKLIQLTFYNGYVVQLAPTKRLSVISRHDKPTTLLAMAIMRGDKLRRTKSFKPFPGDMPWWMGILVFTLILTFMVIMHCVLLYFGIVLVLP